MKVWCYFGASGRVCADSDFRDAEDAWRTMLGWPTVVEVRTAQVRGDRVMQIEISDAANARLEKIVQSARDKEAMNAELRKK